MEKERKYNYWRGFAVASFFWAVAVAIFLSYIIKIAQSNG